MKQQINLYQPEFHPKKDPLPAIRMLAIAGTLLLLVLSVYGFIAYQAVGLENQLANLQKEEKRLTGNIAELQALIAPKEKSQLLENEIARLATEKEAKKPLIDFLSARQVERSGGFSTYLEALGRQKVGGLWLRRISFGGKTRSMILEGSATDPALVPRYLKRLSADGSFAGVEFSQFRILRSKDNTAKVEFFMETKYAGESDEGS